jgi:hypothetical protein
VVMVEVYVSVVVERMDVGDSCGDVEVSVVW